MLVQHKRESLLDWLAIPLPGKRIVNEAVKYAPVRQVASNGGNVITVYQSRKMQREIRTESRHLEFPAGLTHEHNLDVLEFYPQPCRLKFEMIDGQGEIHQIDHTPDFLLITEKDLILEEWKSQSKLEGLARKYPWRYQLDPEGNWCSPCIELWLAERGVSYRIRTDTMISRRRIENTLFLEDYLHPSAEACPVDVETRIQDAIAEQPVLYLTELYEQANCQPDDAFKLIADGLLVADMDGASLSEPSRCRVFRDRAVRDFERARRPLPPAQPIAGILDIRVGMRL